MRGSLPGRTPPTQPWTDLSLLEYACGCHSTWGRHTTPYILGHNGTLGSGVPHGLIVPVGARPAEKPDDRGLIQGCEVM